MRQQHSHTTDHDAPAAFTVRPLATGEMTRVAGAAAYIKFDGVDGEVQAARAPVAKRR